MVDRLLDLNLPGLALNVRDAAVRESLMTLTTAPRRRPLSASGPSSTTAIR